MSKKSQSTVIPNKQEEDEGEIGDFGEEADLNYVPIEKPKCLSNINNNIN